MVWYIFYFQGRYFIVMIYSPSKQVKNLMILHSHENTIVFCNGRVAYHAIPLMKDAKDYQNGRYTHSLDPNSVVIFLIT